MVEAVVVVLALGTAFTWYQIHVHLKGRADIESPREITLAAVLLAIAVTMHVVEEMLVNVGLFEDGWFFAVILVISIGAVSFWLDASFEIAHGKL